MSQQRKRNPKRETILHQAQQMMLSPAPNLDEVQQVDQAVRRVLADGNPFRQQWIQFFDGVVSRAD